MLSISSEVGIIPALESSGYKFGKVAGFAGSHDELEAEIDRLELGVLQPHALQAWVF